MTLTTAFVEAPLPEGAVHATLTVLCGPIDRRQRVGRDAVPVFRNIGEGGLWASMQTMSNLTRGLRAWLACAMLVCLSLAAPAGAKPGRVGLSVTPRAALLDAPLHIRVTGLRPGVRLTLRATERSVLRRLWVATRSVRANRRGSIDLRRAQLLSFTKPVRAIPPGDSFPAPSAVVRVRASVRGHVLRTRDVRRFIALPGVTMTHERPATTGFFGEYFEPGGPARRGPGIVFIGGSEGGVPAPYVPSLLASRGYRVLSLAYFGEPGLPPALGSIPLEYFQRALEWLARQPGVDPKRLVVAGVSRGGEAALIIGSTYPQLVRAVVAYVPSSEVLPAPGAGETLTPAWTLNGHRVPFGPIPVEKIPGPLFAAGGFDDQIWTSGLYVNDIERRMHAYFRTDFVALQYVGVGHALGAVVPNIPTPRSVRIGADVLHVGGSPAADAVARADSWPRLLRFLARV